MPDIPQARSKSELPPIPQMPDISQPQTIAEKKEVLNYNEVVSESKPSNIESPTTMQQQVPPQQIQQQVSQEQIRTQQVQQQMPQQQMQTQVPPQQQQQIPPILEPQAPMPQQEQVPQQEQPPTEEELEKEEAKEKREIDPLLESLVFLSKYYQRTTSRTSLTYGLAIHNNSMSVDSFITSSKRIGLIPKVVERELSNISTLALPSILLLEGNKACVLTSLNLTTAEIILPGLSDGVTTISIKELEEDYIGKVIIIKPKYNFHSRIANEIVIPKPNEWFWGALKRNVHIYKNVIVSAIIINIFVLASPLFSKNVFDRVLPNNAIETMWAMTAGIAMVMIFDLILKMLRAHFIGKAGKRADVIISNNIFNKLLDIKLDERPGSTGQFVSKLQSFESVREFFTSATVAAMVDIPFILFFIAIIFYFAGNLGWIPVIATVLILGFAYWIRKKSAAISEQSSKEDQLKQTTLHETVAGLEVVKSIRAHNRMKVHWEQALSQTTYYNEKLQFLTQINSFFTAFVSQVANIAVMIVGIYMAMNGDSTMGGIVAAMMLSGRVLQPLGQIVGLLVRWNKTMTSFNNLNELMALDTENQGTNFLSRPNIKGDIEFKDVTFNYKDQTYEALKDINLTIKEGEKVAILGKIGSGKSTLYKMIMNLYSPTSGSVLVDNTDVRQIDPADLRRTVGCVPQEPFLFMGTVKDNITIAEQYVSDEELVDVSKITGVHEFLGRHEAGYDLVVGERGEGLSGGERQAVTLARALISNPEVLIMDEPTNSMDKQSENVFIKNIKGVIQDKTFILITHKPSLLVLVDRVIIINNGKIVADGPKEEILAKKGRSA
jgi:ATP-binding cassette subfamily C protein LapB